MADPTHEDWKRLGEELVSRRVALGFRTRSGFAKAKGLKNDRVLAAIENAERTNFSSATLASFDQVYELAPGAINRSLREGVGLAHSEESSVAESRPLGEYTNSELLRELGVRLLEGQLWKTERDVLESRLEIATLPPPSPEEAERLERRRLELLIEMMADYRSRGEDPIAHGGFTEAQVAEADAASASRGDELQRVRESRKATPASAPPVPEGVAADDPGEPSEGEQRREEHDRGYGIDQDGQNR